MPIPLPTNPWPLVGGDPERTEPYRTFIPPGWMQGPPNQDEQRRAESGFSGYMAGPPSPAFDPFEGDLPPPPAMHGPPPYSSGLPPPSPGGTVLPPDPALQQFLEQLQGAEPRPPTSQEMLAPNATYRNILAQTMRKR